MKRTPKKLVLRRETLRTLPNMDLVRAVGGFDTGAKACQGPVVYQSGAAQCDVAVVVIATATAACG